MKRRLLLTSLLIVINAVTAELIQTSQVAQAAGDDSTKPQDEATNELAKLEAKEAAVRATEETKLWDIALDDGDRTAAIVEKSAGLRWSWSNDGRYYGDVYI
ncbi:MAG TPA: hypothetical protein VGH74_03140, partial [Planctomycetaceae bacterium]